MQIELKSNRVSHIGQEKLLDCNRIQGHVHCQISWSFLLRMFLFLAVMCAPINGWNVFVQSYSRNPEPGGKYTIGTFAFVECANGTIPFGPRGNELMHQTKWTCAKSGWGQIPTCRDGNRMKQPFVIPRKEKGKFEIFGLTPARFDSLLDTQKDCSCGIALGNGQKLVFSYFLREYFHTCF